MPSSTNLVTNLPADFNVFGQGVDTSMAGLLGGTTGQILSKTSGTNMAFTWIANDQGDITGVTATSPLTGGGSSGALTIGIQDASTAQKGSVQLSDSTSTTSSILASTPTAVKSAYDLAAAAIPTSTVTTTGDIIYRNATVPTRLGVGTTGQVLTVAGGVPSWATPATGSSQVAGKNAIINGDFLINQRSFTSNTADGAYNFDRWFGQRQGGLATFTPQTFTPGAAPIAGVEGRNYLQCVNTIMSAAGDYGILSQRIEDVTRYAGQTVTISFYAKAATGTPNVGVQLIQNFGSGGSPSAEVSIPVAAQAISTSWTRYSLTQAVPSISGKTLGTTENTSYLQLNLWTSAGSTYATPSSSTGTQNNTFSIWGVQLEYGSSVTYFTTATGSLGGELALCQRYYWRMSTTATGVPIGMGTAVDATTNWTIVDNPQPMRAIPTSADWLNLKVSDAVSFTNVVTALVFNTGGTLVNIMGFTTSGQTAKVPVITKTGGTTVGYFGLSAEL